MDNRSNRRELCIELKEVIFNDSSVRTRLSIAFMDVPHHYVCVLIPRFQKTQGKWHRHIQCLNLLLRQRSSSTRGGRLLGIIIIIIIIIIITAIELSLGGSSPYTTTDKTNTNKYT